MSVQGRFIAKNGLDNNSKTITGVATPVNANDAATKDYVDNKTATLADSGVVAGSYGSATTIPVVTVNSKGIIISASTVDVAATSGGSGLASSNAKNFFFN